MKEFELECPACGEENPPGFPVCWNCHEELPKGHAPREDQETAATPLTDQEPPLEEPRDRSLRKKRLALELFAVLAALWLPLLLGGLTRPPTRLQLDLVTELISIASGLGTIGLLVYLAWLDGPWKRVLGFRRPRLVAEALWSLGVCALMLLGQVSVNWISFLLESEVSEAAGFEVGATRWVVVLSFLVWAFVEEILYRGYLWIRIWELTRRPYVSIVVCALLFSIPHVYPWEWTLCLFLEGCVLGLIFQVRRSIWALAIGHWLFNLVVLFN